MLCKCHKKSSGERCGFKAKEGSIYCGFHKSCENPVRSASPKGRSKKSKKSKKCPPNKVLDPDTLRCLMKCKPGQVRNPKTKRCKKQKNSASPKKKIRVGRKQGIILPLSAFPSSPLQLPDDVQLPYSPCIINSRLPLLPHQVRVVSFLNKPKVRGLLAIHDVGTGKTLTAVTATQCFLSQSPDHLVIVVTPTSLQENFKKEVRNYGANPLDARYRFFTIQGFRNAVERKEINVAQLPNTMLILDEAHNIRADQEIGDALNEEEDDEEEAAVDKPMKIGVYAKALINTAKYCKKVLLLTATPLINFPADIVNLIAMINGEEPIHPNQLKHISLPEYLRCKTSVFERSEDYKDQYLPRTTINNICLPMDPSYLTAYKRVEITPEVNEKAFYNGLRRISNTIDKSSSPKVNWIMNFLKEKFKERASSKYVIFSHFIECGIKLLMTLLEQAGIPFRHISGALSAAKRAEAVSLFNEDKINVLLITKAGGEGLDLKNTTGVILMEPSWNESANYQVIGRAVRYKSHESLPVALRMVHIYHLFMVKPVERDVINDVLDRALVINELHPSEKLSVDLYMRSMSLRKQLEIDRFMDFIKRYSIELQRCDYLA